MKAHKYLHACYSTNMLLKTFFQLNSPNNNARNPLKVEISSPQHGYSQKFLMLYSLAKLIILTIQNKFQIKELINHEKSQSLKSDNTYKNWNSQLKGIRYSSLVINDFRYFRCLFSSSFFTHFHFFSILGQDRFKSSYYPFIILFVFLTVIVLTELCLHLDTY